MLSSTVHIVVSPSLEGGAALRPPRHRPSYSFLNFGARRAPVVRLTGPPVSAWRFRLRTGADQRRQAPIPGRLERLPSTPAAGPDLTGGRRVFGVFGKVSR